MIRTRTNNIAGDLESKSPTPRRRVNDFLLISKHVLNSTAKIKKEIKMKIYNSPEISFIDIEATDIITTSDILSGVETPPTEVGGGSWETI